MAMIETVLLLVPDRIVIAFVAELTLYRFRPRNPPIPELLCILENDNTPVP
jgi:hypothetical protein